VWLVIDPCVKLGTTGTAFTSFVGKRMRSSTKTLLILLN